MSRRRYSRNEKIFYILSLIIVITMILGLIVPALSNGF
jgi:hypothetical protein